MRRTGCRRCNTNRETNEHIFFATAQIGMTVASNTANALHSLQRVSRNALPPLQRESRNGCHQPQKQAIFQCNRPTKREIPEQAVGLFGDFVNLIRQVGRDAFF